MRALHATDDINEKVIFLRGSVVHNRLFMNICGR